MTFSNSEYADSDSGGDALAEAKLLAIESVYGPVVLKSTNTLLYVAISTAAVGVLWVAWSIAGDEPEATGAIDPDKYSGAQNIENPDTGTDPDEDDDDDDSAGSGDDEEEEKEEADNPYQDPGGGGRPTILW
ncbi:MAG TPA: hypothetical protein QGF58_27960 [Myxococcota bacterium]|nr:hypothetical protein [Myxococcota bacterium]